MNIIFLSPHRNLGGALSANINMARSLQMAGHKVFFFNEYVKEINGLQNDIFPIHQNGFFHQFRSYRYLKSKKPDVIIIGVSGLGVILLISLFLFRANNVKVAQIFHSLSLGTSFRDRIIDLIQSMVSIVCTHLIFVSNYTLKSWSKFFTIRMFNKNNYVVYNAIATVPFISERNCVKTIGFVGRFSLEKQPALFAEVAKIMHSNAGLHFEAWGNGPLLDECINKYSDYVDFKGASFNHETIYQNIDILVLTSKFENCPMVILEAAARGIPCIAPNVGGIPEIIQHNKNGLLYDNYSVENIVKCIETMIPSYKRYSNCAQDYVNAFSLDHQSKVFKQLFY